MKLIIQIPCKDEEETLPIVFAELPKKIPGVDVVEYMIIDDGSTDRTVEVAKELGVHHILSFPCNRGLGYAFSEGVKHALYLGADIVVNTDGDNQYPGKFIPDLIQPILDKEADLTIGDRHPTKVEFFSAGKQFLQGFGNWAISRLLQQPVPDAVSGFRAYSREILFHIFVTSKFSYVLDTLVQAYYKGFSVAWVDIHTHAPTRPSRLFKSIPAYLRRTGVTLIRIYVMYESLRFFLAGAVFFMLLAFLEFGLGWFVSGNFATIAWLSLGLGAGIVAVLLFAIAVISDLLAKDRLATHQILAAQRKAHSNASQYAIQ